VENGSCVKIYIPLGKEHFEGDARVKFIEPEVMKVAPEETKVLVTAEEKSRQIEEEQETLSLLTQPTNGKHKILVIEDHKDIRLYLKVLFSSNYTVIMAENGEEGVKMARCEMPDIILSDVMMPVMNGLECTRILKEDLKTCHIPIIILTALVGDTDVVKGIEMGADDYILKPFNPDILRSKVKRLIKNRMDLKQAYMKLMMAGTSSSEKEEDGQKEDPFIRQIFDIVEKNLQNPDFNVKRLAEMVNMSQPTLYRRVKMLTNYTIIELIRGVRLKRAAELLRTKKYSIQEVSEMVGYNDAPTFRKHFVEFYGTTPSTFVSKEEKEEEKKISV
jgi:YesN/AraC family two-component response regulator